MLEGAAINGSNFYSLRKMKSARYFTGEVKELVAFEPLLLPKFALHIGDTSSCGTS